MMEDVGSPLMRSLKNLSSCMTKPTLGLLTLFGQPFFQVGKSLGFVRYISESQVQFAACKFLSHCVLQEDSMWHSACVLSL